MTHRSVFVYFRKFYIAWWVNCDSGLTCFNESGVVGCDADSVECFFFFF